MIGGRQMTQNRWREIMAGINSVVAGSIFRNRSDDIQVSGLRVFNESSMQVQIMDDYRVCTCSDCEPMFVEPRRSTDLGGDWTLMMLPEGTGLPKDPCGVGPAWGTAGYVDMVTMDNENEFRHQHQPDPNQLWHYPHSYQQAAPSNSGDSSTVVSGIGGASSTEEIVGCHGIGSYQEVGPGRSMEPVGCYETNKCCEGPGCHDSPKDADVVPEQNLTFSSPESAFYDYQKRMEKQLCQVCKESAAGFHHGAYVCEACKKFFMRHFLGRTRFSVQCPTGGHCALQRPGRIKCQSCRFRKCLAVGMNLQGNNGVHPKFDISNIPCRVCKGKSSGFHFGALTCEGCKGFFRRTVNVSSNGSHQQQLVCVRGTLDCTLAGTNSRSMCKACRFQRCLAVGMSKKGSRIGRQPNAVKFHCVLEIVHQQVLASPEIVTAAAEVSPQPSPAGSFKVEHSAQGWYAGFDNVASSDEESLLVFHQMILDATLCQETAKINLKRQSIQNWKLQDGFNITDLWAYMMSYFEFHSAMVVQFVKAIPGFNEFALVERRRLVQESMYPMMLLRLAGDYNPSTNECNYFDFSTIDRQRILTAFPIFRRLVQHLVLVSRAVYAANLDHLQLSLLSVLELMRNDQCNESKKAGALIVNKTKTLLQTSAKESFNPAKTGPSMTESDRLRIIFETLPHELNKMNLEHQQIILQLREERSDLYFPELFVDMFRIHSDSSNTASSMELYKRVLEPVHSVIN